MTVVAAISERDGLRRWGGSLAVVLAAHAAPVLVLAWWLAPVISTAPPSASPSAVMVDMAPLPAATAAPPTEVPPGQKQQRTEAPKPPVPEKQPKLPVVAKAAVALPQAPDTPKHPEDKTPVQETTAPPSAAAPPAAAAAPAANAPAPSNAAPTWQGLVLGRLEQFKRYPVLAQTRNQQGIAYLRFTMDRNGKVLSARIDKGSGYDLLDAETLALIHRAEPLPKPPAEVVGETLELVVPIEFFISSRR